MENFVLLQVDRIENWNFKLKYEQQRLHLARERRESKEQVTEEFLFHGTRGTDPIEILTSKDGLSLVQSLCCFGFALLVVWLPKFFCPLTSLFASLSLLLLVQALISAEVMVVFGASVAMSLPEYVPSLCLHVLSLSLSLSLCLRVAYPISCLSFSLLFLLLLFLL
jgi:hypothetical protein